MSNLSFIVAAFGEDEPSFSMCESVGEGADIIAAIFEEEFSEAMWFLIFPLSPIDDSWWLDEMGRSSLRFYFFAGSVLKLVEYFHFLPDVVADLGLYGWFCIFGWARVCELSFGSSGLAWKFGGFLRGGDGNGFSVVVVVKVGIVGVVFAAGSLAHLLN